MRILKPIGVLLTGVFVGAVLAGRGASRLEAQQQEPQLTLTLATFAPRILNGVNAEGRPMMMSDVRPPLGFVRDIKTNGCWLAALGDRGQVVSVAVAPSAACTQ